MVWTNKIKESISLQIQLFFGKWKSKCNITKPYDHVLCGMHIEFVNEIKQQNKNPWGISLMLENWVNSPNELEMAASRLFLLDLSWKIEIQFPCINLMEICVQE